MQVIAVSGWKRSGKDTLAEYLIKNHRFTRYGFADKLKDNVARDFGIPRSHCDDPLYKEFPIAHMPVNISDSFVSGIHNLLLGEFAGVAGHGQLYWTPRALCIFEGSGKRAVMSDYWVKQVISGIREYESLNSLIVISDIRYKTEIEQLRAEFGDSLVTVRVNRFDTCTSTDASERDLDDAEFDHVFENRGTLKEFENQIKRRLIEVSDQTVAGSGAWCHTNV